MGGFVLELKGFVLHPNKTSTILISATGPVSQL